MRSSRRLDSEIAFPSQNVATIYDENLGFQSFDSMASDNGFRSDATSPSEGQPPVRMITRPA